MRGYLLLALLLLVVAPLRAEPGVALLLDSRKPDQAELTAFTKKCLYTLIKANELSTVQFSVLTADFAQPAVSTQWKNEYQITGADLPALAFYTRNGNKITIANLIRRYHNPIEAAQQAFQCVGVSFPELVTETQIHTEVCVNSTPAAATIKLDGHEVGLTHSDIPVTPGLHIIELSHADCEPYDATVNVSLGQTVEVNVPLTLQPAQLVLESKGPALNVTVDDQPFGRMTPVALNLTAGSHHVVARAPGFYEVDGDINLAGKKATRVLITPTQATIRVGWAGVRTTGYSSYAPGLPGTYRSPIQIRVPENTITTKGGQAIAARPHMQLVAGDGACDCALGLEIKASGDNVLGTVHLMDAQGRDLQTFTAERDMPLLTLDEQGSVEKRAQEVADELMTRALDAVPKIVRGSPIAPDGEPSGIQVSVEELK